jgi:uncharacterized membrane protein (GlpM family)
MKVLICLFIQYLDGTDSSSACTSSVYPVNPSLLISANISSSSHITPGMFRESVWFALDIQPAALLVYLLAYAYYIHKLESSSASSCAIYLIRPSLLRSAKVASSSWLINVIICHPSQLFSPLPYALTYIGTYLHLLGSSSDRSAFIYLSKPYSYVLRSSEVSSSFWFIIPREFWNFILSRCFQFIALFTCILSYLHTVFT